LKWRGLGEQQKEIQYQWKMDPFDPEYSNTVGADHLLSAPPLIWIIGHTEESVQPLPATTQY